MKYIKPSMDIYSRLIEDWNLISLHIGDAKLKEKFIETLQYMYMRTGMKSKLKVYLGKYIADVKQGRNPAQKGEEIIEQNPRAFKDMQEVMDEEDEEEEDEEI